MTFILSPRMRQWLALGCIGVLLAILAGREVLARWQTLQQWRSLATSAAALQVRAPLAIEQLRQSAEQGRLSIELAEVREGSWLLTGRVSDERHLHDWLLHIRGEGAKPLGWNLQRGESDLGFEVVISP